MVNGLGISTLNIAYHPVDENAAKNLDEGDGEPVPWHRPHHCHRSISSTQLIDLVVHSHGAGAHTLQERWLASASGYSLCNILEIPFVYSFVHPRHGCCEFQVIKLQWRGTCALSKCQHSGYDVVAALLSFHDTSYSCAIVKSCGDLKISITVVDTSLS